MSANDIHKECLSNSAIERCASGKMGDAEAVRARGHLEACAACRMQVEMLADESDAIFERIRHAFPTEGVEGVTQTHATRTDAGASGLRSPALAPVIDGYEIVHEIHRGGQGVVYQALQRRTKRKVAIKVLLEGPLASGAARKRFEREIELVAQLKHPNIIAVFHSGESKNGMAYCVMDYVRGARLDHHIRDNNLSLRDALRLFSEICDAVNYAHLKGVIHRDLKPSNILVDDGGVPKVLDFGLAKQTISPAESLLSVTGQVMGTLPYMSPEQVRANPDEIDTRTDVYSLGVILYELLTGRYPYTVVGQMADVLKNIAEKNPAPPSQQWTIESGIKSGATRRSRSPSCPIDDEVQTIIMRSLAKERERRYQSAGDLGRDIDAYLNGDAIEAKRDSSLYVLRKLAAKHKVESAALFVVFAMAVSFGMVYFYLYKDLRSSQAAERLSGIAALKAARDTDQAVAAYSLPAIREMQFGWFLLALEEGRMERAREILDRFQPEQPEHMAMSFLLDDGISPVALLSELPDRYDRLGHFAIGLRNLKNDEMTEAREAFELALDGGRLHAWLRREAEAYLARLNELQRETKEDTP